MAQGRAGRIDKRPLRMQGRLVGVNALALPAHMRTHKGLHRQGTAAPDTGEAHGLRQSLGILSWAASQSPRHQMCLTGKGRKGPCAVTVLTSPVVDAVANGHGAQVHPTGHTRPRLPGP